ncbi:MAG: hypothetical protein WCA08_18475 [Desulfoferrobacter sp.]
MQVFVPMGIFRAVQFMVAYYVPYWPMNVHDVEFLVDRHLIRVR